MPPAIQLQTQLDSTLRASLQPSTANSYQHHWQSFQRFVTYHLQQPSAFPALVNHICLFLIHLHNASLTHNTIRTYLSAISFVHKLHNHPDPTTAFVVSKTMQGIRNQETPTNNQLLPITKSVLISLLGALPFAVVHNYELSMWHALFLFTYHGCLRSGEVTLSTNPANVIQLSQVSVLQDLIHIHFKRYKHSQGATPIITIMAEEDRQHCPVRALATYLTHRGQHIGPLFCNANTTPVTRAQFAEILKTTAAMSSLQPHQYNTHSFRIGRATQLAVDGQPDQLIRAAGRWKSSAYQRYIRPTNVVLP